MNESKDTMARVLAWGAAALVVALLAAPLIHAEVETQTGVSTTGPVGRVRVRVTGGPSISSGTNLLTSALTVNSAAQDSRFVVEVQLGTTSTLNVIATPYLDGVAQVASRTTLTLNGGTAITGGHFYTGSEAFTFTGVGVSRVETAGTVTSHTYYETYQLRFGTTSALNRLIVTEWYGGNTMGRAGGGSSSGGGGSATLNGITNPGAGELLWSVAGSGNSQITGPSDDGFVVTAGSARSLNLYADNGNGSSIQVASDGHIELNAAGPNQDIQLTPSGSGAVVANPIASGAGDDLDLRAPSGDINLRPNSDASGVGGTVQVRAPVLAINDAAGEVQFGFPVDVGLKRSAAGVFKVTNGSTGIGAISASQLATGHVYRLPVSYGSATTINVGPGNCRSATDNANLVLTTDNPISITTGNDFSGLNQRTLHTGTPAITATTHGTTTFQPSASIVAALNPRVGNGTISTDGSGNVTGLSMNDLAVGDLVGSSTTYGWGQVTAWTPPTTPTGTNGVATLSAALPGGNASGITFTIIENATIWPGATAGDKRRISTLTAAGTQVVVSGAALTSSAAGANLTIGVKIPSCWYAVHAIRTADGSMGAFVSTQRNTPYAWNTAAEIATAAIDANRWIGVAYNDSSGNLVAFSTSGNGSTVTYQWECGITSAFGNTQRPVNGGTTGAAWHRVDCSSIVPAGCRQAQATIQLAANGTASFRASGIGDAATDRRSFQTSNPANLQLCTKMPLLLDGSSAFDYTTSADLYVDVYGFNFDR